MDENKQQIMEEVNKKLIELTEMEQMESFLKSNVNEFQYKEQIYRVHKPKAYEKDEANKERMKKYLKMLQDPDYKFRKEWVSLYKTKDIDIDKMESNSRNSYVEEKELLRRLGKTEDVKDVVTLKKRILELREEQQQIFIEKEDLLKYCIEKQLEDFIRFYLLYLLLEVKNGDTWERVFKSYAEFESFDDDLLLGRAAQVLAVIVYNANL